MKAGWKQDEIVPQPRGGRNEDAFGTSRDRSGGEILRYAVVIVIAQVVDGEAKYRWITAVHDDLQTKGDLAEAEVVELREQRYGDVAQNFAEARLRAER